MLTHDEPLLVAALSSLPHRAKVAFAVACVRRLAAALESKGMEMSLALAATEQLRAFATGGGIEDTSALESNLLAAMPADDDVSTLAASVGEDALAAAVYALRCAASDDAMDAVWAARRAYEATDWFAGQSLSAAGFTEDVEAAILSHPAVQTELRRQRRDLEQLSEMGGSEFIERVIERADREPILG